MIEMLTTLAIIGVLVAIAVWGIMLAFNKHKANQILEDASLGLQSLAERRDEEGEVELGFTPESGYETKGVMIMYSEGRADFVKVVAVRQKVCDILNKMQGDKLAIYQSYQDGAGLTKLTECTEENTMYITFTDYGQSIGGCYPGCDNNMHCVNFYECKCDEGYIYYEETDSCQIGNCGTSRPISPLFLTTKACCEYWSYKWNRENNICECSDNSTMDEETGQCVMCSALTNGECQRNLDCCTEGDFCAFLEPVDDTDKGIGKCIPITTYDKEELIVLGEKFVRTSVSKTHEINWWTAQNWCDAQGYDSATRDTIGCGTKTGNAHCTSEIWTALMDAGWKVKNFNTERYASWLEKSSSTIAWCVYYRDGGIGNIATGEWGNPLSKTERHYALCHKHVCDAGMYWDKEAEECTSCANLPSPQETTSKKCCLDRNWRWVNESVCLCPKGQVWRDDTQNCSYVECWATYKKEEYESDLCELSYTKKDKGALCQIKFSDTSSSLAIQEYDTCAIGTYCYISHKDEDRLVAVTNNATNTVYGRCIPMKDVGSLYGYELEETVPCPRTHYCHIAYTDEDRTVAITNAATGPLYGTCIPLKEVGTLYNYRYTEQQGCGQNEYCRLQWKTDTDCTPIENASSNLYGVCVPLMDNEYACPHE